MIEIKYYSEQYETFHAEFAKKYWKKERRFIPEYIYWKFRGSQEKELKSFILAIEGEKVIGQFGLIPCEVLIDDELIEGQWACDLMVDSDYRGKGVAEKLYDFAHQNKAITLGSDPSPAAEKSMLKKGYLSLEGPRKFVFPVKIGEIFKLKGINNSFLNRLPNPFLVVLFFIKNSDYKLINQREYSELNHYRVREQLYCNHDSSYYNWRFSAFKPYYQGIECYQKDDFNFFSGYFINGLYFLTDFRANSLGSFLRMISFIYFKYRKSDIARIKFVSMEDSKINRKLPFLGFVLFRTLTKVIMFTKDEKIKRSINKKKFYYTLHDSDENI
ncbi:GNAT family N-acetyltransferase [Flavobacterium sp. PLA-1-15]|uniref:GNAT family N-acetyltransferase n=1 Tax=Flavobacterium sp. PLA-1-15 TaxID=3380533 RepID=UPI003B80E942